MKMPIMGFFEELITMDEPRRCLGTRIVPYTPGRLFGYSGMREEVITSDFVLNRGHKTQAYKASPAKPIHVQVMLQMLNGHKMRDDEVTDGPYYTSHPPKIHNLPGYPV